MSMRTEVHFRCGRGTLRVYVCVCVWRGGGGGAPVMTRAGSEPCSMVASSCSSRPCSKGAPSSGHPVTTSSATCTRRGARQHAQPSGLHSPPVAAPPERWHQHAIRMATMPEFLPGAHQGCSRYHRPAGSGRQRPSQRPLCGLGSPAGLACSIPAPPWRDRTPTLTAMRARPSREGRGRRKLAAGGAPAAGRGRRAPRRPGRRPAAPPPGRPHGRPGTRPRPSAGSWP